MQLYCNNQKRFLDTQLGLQSELPQTQNCGAAKHRDASTQHMLAPVRLHHHLHTMFNNRQREGCKQMHHNSSTGIPDMMQDINSKATRIPPGVCHHPTLAKCRAL